MNKKGLLAAIIIILLAAGGWWYMKDTADNKSDTAANEQSNTQTNTDEARSVGNDDFGTYPYYCTDGTEFTMTPTADVGSLVLMPGTKATFPRTTLTKTSSTAGQRYEGPGLAFVGAGEDVTLTTGQITVACSPKPKAGEAPFNFGDAGEGGGVQQDIILIVSENLIGRWQSVDDPKLIREFKISSVTDSYDGKTTTSGTWKVFNKEQPVQTSFPLADGATYIQLSMSGTQADTLSFKIDKLTPEELQLTSIDRGSVLKFKNVK